MGNNGRPAKVVPTPRNFFRLRSSDPYNTHTRHAKHLRGEVPPEVSSSSKKPLEQAGLLLGVGDEEVLRLLVVVEHHEVGLAADAGLLVAAERGVRGGSS